VRGVVALIAGGGESTRVYERFSRRLSADGYSVAVFEAPAAPAAARWLASQSDAPRVLAGSDRGAAAALALAAEGAAADGVIVAGLPATGVDDASASAEERTSCPVHLGVLRADDARSASDGPVADIPDAGALARLDVPALALHGGADTIAPLTAARAVLSTLPRVEVVEAVGALHDVLNDQSHRSVAASIVLWLERLRAGDVASPIVRSVQP
jgi:alpha-beta hydrolase superfamily lysophospholipase